MGLNDESLAVMHARKQGHADGFQTGWYAALTRVGEGESVSELRALVPSPAQAAMPGASVDAGEQHPATNTAREAQEPAPTLAARFFAQGRLEHEVDEALMLAFGATNCGTADDIDTDTKTWPCSHMAYDDYDNSFELWGCQPGWEPTKAQIDAAMALGFSRFWLCYTDGTERYNAGALKASPTPRNHDGKYELAKRDKEIVRLTAALTEARAALAQAQKEQL